MLCKTTVMFIDACDNWLARVSISGSNKDDRGHVRCSEESDCDLNDVVRVFMWQDLVCAEHRNQSVFDRATCLL